MTVNKLVFVLFKFQYMTFYMIFKYDSIIVFQINTYFVKHIIVSQILDKNILMHYYTVIVV